MTGPGFQPNLLDDWRKPPRVLVPPAPTPNPSDAALQEFVDYTYAMPPVDTPDLRAVRRVVEEVQAFNAARPCGSRQIGVINSAPHHGKTTSVVTIALAQARTIWAVEDAQKPLSIPWVYVNATSGGEGRSVASGIASFCSLPRPSSRPTMADYLDQISHTSRGIGLENVFIDDIHALRRIGGKDGRTIADGVKGLVTTLPVNCFAAGVGLRSHPLFADAGSGRIPAAQLLNRARWVELTPWPTLDRHGYYTDDWLTLLAQVSDYLRFPKGTRQNRLNTRKTIDYLLQGAEGRPGTAIEWVLKAAVWSIRTGNPLDKTALTATRGRGQ